MHTLQLFLYWLVIQSSCGSLQRMHTSHWHHHHSVIDHIYIFYMHTCMFENDIPKPFLSLGSSSSSTKKKRAQCNANSSFSSGPSLARTHISVYKSWNSVMAYITRKGTHSFLFEKYLHPACFARVVLPCFLRRPSQR
jgi:hypothetical protein